MTAKYLLPLCLMATTLTAGAITSGNMSASRGFNSFVSYNVALNGTNLNGNPFSLAFYGLADGFPGYMGAERCPSVGGAPVSINCTWDFANPDTLDTSDYPFANGGQIVWDGTTYDLTAGSPYTVKLIFNVNASPVTVASTVGGTGSHSWAFPAAPATVAIDLTILQGTNPLVSETLSGAFRYSGSAFQPIPSSDWTTRISHQAVPEPASLFTCAAGLLAAAAVLRRRS